MYNFRSIFFTFFYLIIGLLSLSSLDLSLNLGIENKEIGYVSEKNGYWFPIFFAVDEEETVHLPDFFKNRIVRFSFDGQYLGETLTTVQLSPNMNYFTLTSRDTYLTFSQNTLYQFTQNGELIWQYAFPIGTIPVNILALDSGIFILLSPLFDDDGRTIFFSYDSATPLGRSGYHGSNGKEIPIAFNLNGDIYPMNLDDMRFLNNIDITNTYEKQAILSYLSKDQALWINSKDNIVSLYTDNNKRIISTSIKLENHLTNFFILKDAFYYNYAENNQIHYKEIDINFQKKK